VNVHKIKYLKCCRRQEQLKPINIENKETEQVRSFKYLGSTVNTDSTVEEESKERISLGMKRSLQMKRYFKATLHLKRHN